MSWKIDHAHSAIEFKVRHMMVAWVRGSFRSFEGTVEFDEANPSNTEVHITIDPGSINTGEAPRDAHLRSADFFDAGAYPAITFTSRRVELIDDSYARLVGDLTIRDVTHEVVLDVEYSGTATSPYGMIIAGFSARTQISRKDWNLTWNVALETGGVLVGDDITLDIQIELVKEQEAVAEAAV
jgi:polyisoprenoid-binding protein YceI